jgi:hypothetical protein
MANKRISSLDDITVVGGTSTAEVNANDILPITDVDDTTGSLEGTTKGVKVSDLLANAPDNSTDVTLATVANNYLSLSGQEITAGIVPVSLGGTGSGDLSTVRANLGLGTAATTASTDYATAAQGTTADSAVQPTDSIDVLADVDTSTVAPTTDDLLKWNGSNFVPGTVSVDVDTPLNTALRGTDNPHIGAFPNQSFKVTDNPYKSVMVIADADGNLDFLVKTDDANIFLNTPSARKAASFGFSVVEDSTEPDIEVAGTLVGSVENYSVISGDSDTKGVNGLPIRQGFNNPDIGANPAPILISGGSIA